MTPRELLNAIDGYSENEQEKALLSWKQARWQAWVALVLKDKQTDKIKPQDLLPLEEAEITAIQQPIKQLDPERIAALEAKWDKAIQTKKPND